MASFHAPVVNFWEILVVFFFAITFFTKVEVFLPKFRADLPCHSVHCWMYADYKLNNTSSKNIFAVSHLDAWTDG